MDVKLLNSATSSFNIAEGFSGFNQELREFGDGHSNPRKWNMISLFDWPSGNDSLL